jgi:hypothetical protein
MTLRRTWYGPYLKSMFRAGMLQRFDEVEEFDFGDIGLSPH